MTDRDGGRDSGDEHDGRKPSMRVIDRVAAANGVEPATLDPPLHDVVDPAALDGLVGTTEAGTTANCAVTFPYAGHEVTLSPDGGIRLG